MLSQQNMECGTHQFSQAISSKTVKVFDEPGTHREQEKNA